MDDLHRKRGDTPTPGTGNKYKGTFISSFISFRDHSISCRFNHSPAPPTNSIILNRGWRMLKTSHRVCELAGRARLVRSISRGKSRKKVTTLKYIRYSSSSFVINHSSSFIKFSITCVVIVTHHIVSCSLVRRFHGAHVQKVKSKIT